MDPRIFMRDGFRITVSFPDDEYPDLSYLGCYEHRTSSKFKLPAYDRATHKVVMTQDELEAVLEEVDDSDFHPRHEYRWIVMGDGEPDYLKQDAERLDNYGREWHCIGVVVEVRKAEVLLGTASVWGIESDSGKEYLDALAKEQVEEAVEAAKAKLEALCRG
jgi:hypothetical protein